MNRIFYFIFILSSMSFFASCEKQGKEADLEAPSSQSKADVPIEEWLIGGKWAAYNEKDYKESALLTHFTFTADKKFTCIFVGDIQMGGHGGFRGPFEVIDKMVYCYYKFEEHGKNAYISLRIDKKTDETALLHMVIVKQKDGEESHNFDLYCKRVKL